MTLKKSIVIDDRRCICKNCSKANTCEIYTKYQKLLDMFENIDPNQYLIKMTCHIRSCNQLVKDKETRCKRGGKDD